MSLASDLIRDRLRSAQQQELLTSEGLLVSDLLEVMTTERLQEGLQVNFGDNREDFRRAIAAIGLTELLGNHSEGVHIHNVFLASEGSTSFVGKAIPALKQIDIVDGIDALQADCWETYLDSIYTKIRARRRSVRSQILITNSVYDEDGTRLADLEKPGVAVGALYTYLPDFIEEDGSYTEESLVNFLKLSREGYRNGDNVVWQLAEELAASGLRLSMPRRSYFLKIGNLARIYMSYGDVSIGYDNKFELVNGRVSAS